ncbi:MAG TPA: transposase [Thermoplasmataceae archaeon]|nr:transposase [Thermoplasmataceae archaeon]
MTERRRWKAEEKLALINEIKEKGQVVETCRKYGTDPTMFYRWKEIFDTYGVEGLRSRTRHSDPSVRKLKKENERLKKMLAERELEVEMLQEAYKKRRRRQS